jgi:ketosteroid isomerase-like protein
MASAKVESVRLGFEIFNGGDWEAASNVRDDFVWLNDPDVAHLSGTAQATGPDQLRNFWDEFSRQWEAFRMDPGEAIESDSGAVMVSVHFTARGRGSGVPIHFDFFQVWEFAEDGRPLRISNVRDRDAALAAAGLDHSSQA